jgi:HD-like signal output (HDOD) protein
VALTGACASLDELVDRITEVCPLPTSVQRVVSLTSQEDAEIKQIVEAVAGDPALAAEVLRVANSSAFGYSRKVSDLGHAVMTIGFRELHQMAVGMALLAAFRSKEELSLHLHDYGLLAGALAQRISKESRRIDAGGAFLSGLLSEIGAMACLAVDAPGYVQIWREAFDGWDGSSLDPWLRRAELETPRYGGTTAAIGAKLLRRNLVPESIAAAVEASTESDPDELSDHGRITAVARVVSVMIVHAGQSTNPSLLDEVVPRVAECFHLHVVGAERLNELCRDTAAAAGRWARTHR